MKRFSPNQPISDTQALILDLVLFLDYNHIFSVVQEHLTVDLDLYILLLCILGLLVFICRRTLRVLGDGSRLVVVSASQAPTSYKEIV
jgi:hypothetical protein